MYEQLKVRPDNTPIQERLLLLVHLQKNRIRMKEMEIYALAGMNETNGKVLDASLNSYRRLLFPGIKEESTSEDSALALAQRALAAEAQKVLLIKPASMEDALRRGGGSSDYGKLAGEAIKHKESQAKKWSRFKAKEKKE